MTSCCEKSQSLLTLDLGLGPAHLMDIIEGPTGLCFESILIRYHAPSGMEDLEDEANEYHVSDDHTVKSSSAVSFYSNQPHARERLRRRQQRQKLDDQIWFLLSSIVNYSKNFKHLNLRFIGCSFPADALAWLLEHAQQIETLHVRVQFHGSLKHLGKALKHHPSLTEVWLDHCLPSVEDAMPTRAKKRSALDKSKVTAESSSIKVVASLEPMLDGLAKSKSLHSLTLSNCTIAVSSTGLSLSKSLPNPSDTSQKPDWNAGASLVKFVHMPSLQKLSLERMVEVRDCDLATMADALQKHHFLTSLSIRQCAAGPLTGQALGRMLSQNKGLQTLDCNMHWWDGVSYEETQTGEYVPKCWENDVLPIVEGLKKNSMLKCLGLYYENLAYTQNAAVISVLGEYVETKTNQMRAQILQEFPKVLRGSVSTEDSSPTVLPPNCALEALIVGHRAFELNDDIEFYLKWNRAGRQYFYQYENATRDDWMDALLINRDDLSVVYALISTNPSMLETV